MQVICPIVGQTQESIPKFTISNFPTLSYVPWVVFKNNLFVEWNDKLKIFSEATMQPGSEVIGISEHYLAVFSHMWLCLVVTAIFGYFLCQFWDFWLLQPYLAIFHANCELKRFSEATMQPQGPAEAIEMSEPGGVLPDQVGWWPICVEGENISDHSFYWCSWNPV